MNKQPTLPVRATTVRYGRHINSGTVGDNDEDIRTTYDTSNNNMPTLDEDNSVRQPQRPLPAPKPPPPLPRSPKPGTGMANIISTTTTRNPGIQHMGPCRPSKATDTQERNPEGSTEVAARRKSRIIRQNIQECQSGDESPNNHAN